MVETSNYPRSCVVPTKAALQRFSRGPYSMQRLLEYMSDRAKVEMKQKELLKAFHRQWKVDLQNIIASNMQDDEMKETARLMSWLDGVKVNFHSGLVEQLYKPGGPVPILTNYVRDPDDVMKRIRAQKIYNAAIASQEKLEADIQKSKQHYQRMKKKEVSMKEKLESADKHDPESSKFKELLEKWKRLESDASLAKDIHHNNVEKECRTRSQFINDMSEYCQESDSYETRRVETMRSVVRQFLLEDKNMLLSRLGLVECYDHILSRLDNYEVDGDLAMFRKFFSYVHKFPDTRIGDRNEQHSSDDDDNYDDEDDDVVRYDTVRVLRPDKDNTASFVQRVQEQEDEQQRVNNYSRHVTLPPPNPADQSYLPEVELPNVVNDRPVYTAPQAKITTLDTSASDKTSSSDSSPEQSSAQLPNNATAQEPISVQQQLSESTAQQGPDLTATQDVKVKVYGLKNFTARRPNELSFKAGHKVYMTKSADARGLAYGYVKKGRLRKKKVFGFFPADLVSTEAKKRSFFKPRNPFKKPKDATSTEDCYVSFIAGEK